MELKSIMHKMIKIILLFMISMRQLKTNNSQNHNFRPNLVNANFKTYIDGLVQDCSNTTANALELLHSCTKPSICHPYENKTTKRRKWHNVANWCINIHYNYKTCNGIFVLSKITLMAMCKTAVTPVC